MAGYVEPVHVRALVETANADEGLKLEVLAGAAGLDRRITNPTFQKTGLAFAGFDNYLQAGRLLIAAESEVTYLAHRSPSERLASMAAVLSRDLPCVLVTEGLTVPAEMASESERLSVPLLWTAADTPSTIVRITNVLDALLAPRDVVHGVLMDILGLGVLIIGESGIGKSECALDLICRGHRLVADDAVDVRRRSDSYVVGSCPDLTRHHIEIRGLGLLNINDLFGVAATRASKRVELVVQLERWVQGHEYDRLGLDTETHDILDVLVPLIRMPVAPGRNLAILVEVAARNQLLRERGYHSARQLADRLDQQLAAEASGEASR